MKDGMSTTKYNYFHAGIQANNMADKVQLINGFEWDAM